MVFADLLATYLLYSVPISTTIGTYVSSIAGVKFYFELYDRCFGTNVYSFLNIKPSDLMFPKYSPPSTSQVLPKIATISILLILVQIVLCNAAKYLINGIASLLVRLSMLITRASEKLLLVCTSLTIVSCHSARNKSSSPSNR